VGGVSFLGACLLLAPLSCRIGESEALLRVAALEQRVEKQHNEFVAFKTDQGTKQEGLINIAMPSAGGIIPYPIMILLALAAWRYWAIKRKLCYGLKHVKAAMEKAGGEDTMLVQQMKRTIARAEANKFGIVGRSNA
jgi:hypothetical protein